MLADKAAISKAIPHAGNMCLLDGVLQCDAQSIQCISTTHKNLNNPLRSDNQLSALCGIEYAAQAMAVHGVMGGQLDQKPRAGFLISLRDVKCNTARLDTLQDDLIINAEKQMGDEARVMYQFDLFAGKNKILSGRATVILDADKEAT